MLSPYQTHHIFHHHHNRYLLPQGGKKKDDTKDRKEAAADEVVPLMADDGVLIEGGDAGGDVELASTLGHSPMQDLRSSPTK